MSEVIIPKTDEEKRQEALKEWRIQWDRKKSAKWYQEHKEEKKEYCKEYYEENKKRINERLAEKVECEACGSMVCRRRLRDHKRTIKCKAIQDRQALETHMNLLSGLGWLGSV